MIKSGAEKGRENDERLPTNTRPGRVPGFIVAHHAASYARLLFLGRVLRLAAGLPERPAQEELDLRIETAQIVVRPALDGLQQRRIDSKQEGFPFGHGSWLRVTGYW
jgi:hypothetical protein